jgi:hypothetical protein
LILSAIYALWLYNKIFSGQIILFKLIYNPLNLGLYFYKFNFNRLWTNYFIDINYREFLIFSQLNFELNYDLII